MFFTQINCFYCNENKISFGIKIFYSMEVFFNFRCYLLYVFVSVVLYKVNSKGFISAAVY